MKFYYSIKGDTESGWSLMAYKYQGEAVTTHWLAPKEFGSLEEVVKYIEVTELDGV